ncbi:hypothetical protein [Pontibacter harenae]|uniref:hypothetical protein n=1 Tax=Pontibacter harenae TaxID=2894083 RepID=UPI001E45589E|nr:hypothetical protein [Pontibacter harenae]MCC9166627.1 hypothetical protein [Pontibacter harenae]
MPAQHENNNERLTLKYLRDHYAVLYKTANVFVDQNQATKRGHVANAIFACTDSKNSFFIASLHTQQSERLAKLLINYKKNGLSKFRFLLAFVVLIASLLAGKQLEHWAFVFIMPVVVTIATFVIHSLLEEKGLKRKINKVADQLKKQPANEQWLSMSVSSICFRNNLMASYLLHSLEARGIGLVTVGKRSKVIVMQRPKTTVCRKGDFISHYASETTIRKALLNEQYLKVA